jgi:hypothetical protein
MRAHLFLALAPLAFAQDAADITVNPNRPTFANPALTTQPGVAELEFGLQRSTFRDGSTAFAEPTLLKLGAAKDFEIRLATSGWLRQTAPGSDAVNGFSDASLGLQWCYVHDGLFGMDQAVQVFHKFPTADADKGLGSGAPDDGVILLFSRDIGSNHLDVNLLETRQGRRAVDGGQHFWQPAGTVSFSHNLSDAWSITGELYGIGANALGPRIVSNLWCVAYKVSPRLVLDAGVDVGLTTEAPKYTVFAGLTVGLGRFRKP